MAIISFWSSKNKETNQTMSMVASAMQMGIERNLKMLMVDATFNSKTINNCFDIDGSSEFTKKLNFGKIDISSGVEGLLTAVSSNKSTPEIVRNYTTPILKDRLDLLPGLKTRHRSNFERAMYQYPEMLNIANKFYDLIFVDLEKGLDLDIVVKILSMSDLIIVTMDQDKELIEEFKNIWGRDPLFSPKEKVIPLLTKEDTYSKYNCDNVARNIDMRPGMPSIVYNTLLMENAQEGGVGKLFYSLNWTEPSGRNRKFIECLLDLDALIIEKIQTQQYAGSQSASKSENILKAHKAYRESLNNIATSNSQNVTTENNNQNDVEKHIDDENQEMIERKSSIDFGNIKSLSTENEEQQIELENKNYNEEQGLISEQNKQMNPEIFETKSGIQFQDIKPLSEENGSIENQKQLENQQKVMEAFRLDFGDIHPEINNNDKKENDENIDDLIDNF